MSTEAIIVFDDDCLFCNKSVQFILERDTQTHFQFASLTSKVAHDLKLTYQIPDDLDSLILIKNDHAYLYSSAVLHICKGLPGIYKIFYCFLVIPKPIRDYIYRLVAKNRKRIRTQNKCILPTEQQKTRFLK